MYLGLALAPGPFRGAYAPLVAIATLPNPRTTIAKAVRDRLAGDFEAQHAEIWRDGERWFGEEDAIWRSSKHFIP